jgi:hypothetical protein
MKEKILEIKEKITELIIRQKILAGVITLIFLMLTGILYLGQSTSGTQQTTTSQQLISNTLTPDKINTTQTSPAKAVENSKSTITYMHPQNNIQNTLTPNQPNTITSNISIPLPPNLTSTSVPNSTSQPAGSTTKSSTNQSQSTTTTTPTTTITTQTNSNNSPASSQNSASSPPKIVFIGPDGKAQTYIPPSDPPVQITWARYTNNLEHYAIDYPSNWQIVTTQYRGHEAIFIYEPDADRSDPDVQYISYGWSSYFYPPSASYTGSFTQDGIPGTIYTNGSIGSSFIAGVFQYYNGFLVLNNNVSDEIFAYIFSHMILSLDFNTP